MTGAQASPACESASPLSPKLASSNAAPLLPHDVTAWLNELEQAQAAAHDDYPKEVTQRIIYVLLPEERPRRSPRLMMQILSARQLKDASYSQTARAFDPNVGFSGNPPKYLRPSDLRIFRKVLLSRNIYGHSSVTTLVGEAGWEILLDILATGRARWLTVNGHSLAVGPNREGEIVWELAEDALMRPRIKTGQDCFAFNAAPPFYVDLTAGLIGTIETGLAPRIATALLDAPPVPAEHVAALGEAMSVRIPLAAKARPLPPSAPVEITEKPAIVLRLFRADLLPETPGYSLQARFPYGYEEQTEPVGLARLLFRYGPIEVPHGEPKPVLMRVHDGKLIEIHRSLKTEKDAARLLTVHGFAPAGEIRLRVPRMHAHDFLPEGDELAWFDAIYSDLPLLRAQGWIIEIAPDFPVRLLNGSGHFDASIREVSGIDWLELDLGIEVDGEKIDLVAPLVALIGDPAYDPAEFETRPDDDTPYYLALPDGRVLALPMARLLPILTALYELACGGAMADMNGRLRLTRGDAAALAEFEAATASAGIAWQGSEQLRDMGRKLAATGGIPAVNLPNTFLANLRPYQQQGVAWLAFLREVGFGAVLADDMGLGKTVQALALIAIEKSAGRLDLPALVVAPTSLMANWRREAEKFVPDLRVLTLQGQDRRKRFGEVASSDLVLTTYPLIARDQDMLLSRAWHILFLDEAQTIKNPDAAMTKLIRRFDARHRFCLTGTPLENHLGELWSLFATVAPGFLGDQRAFTQTFRTPIEKHGDVARSRHLAKRLKPFLLRRTKAEVASELPPKTEIIERIEMMPAQRDIYEAIRLSMHERVRAAIMQKGFARSRIVILDALLKLRQTCCDPRLLKLENKRFEKAGSAKLQRLQEMLDELISEGRRILVFSQFTSMLDLIRPHLDAGGIAYSLLTGKTRARENEIRAFQENEKQVFLVSLKAGGTGLNLTAADTVILYDPWWNPAVEEQAIDRVHRIGQDRPVFIHKLVATGTIEEKMEALKEKKRALAESLFDSEGAPTLAMTAEDIDALLSPA
ncbi:MAG: DEAD/DEAH box helicase [Methylovirgula sp.]